MNTEKKELFYALGLMSGTSLDGIDVALIQTDGESDIRFIASETFPYTSKEKERYQTVVKDDVSLNDVLRIEKEITRAHARAVKCFLEGHGMSSDDIDILGFHGQTIRHLPDEGLTWQLGNISLLSAETNIPVVGDFRRFDMAFSGQGAPLAPLYHKALYENIEKNKVEGAILNIGGVANITLFSASGDVYAGDTGPGCGLLDAYCQKHLGIPFDFDGKQASQGVVDERVLQQALTSVPFFLKKFPKSADRYDFDAVSVSHLSSADALRTLCALTAEGVLSALEQVTIKPLVIYVCGGGAENPVLLSEIEKRTGVSTVHIRHKGLRADSMEAECFAWLSVRSIKNQYISLPTTTGCKKPSIGGILTPNVRN